MNPFVFYLSLVFVVVLLTTCTKSEACPLLAETRPAVAHQVNGDALPYYGGAPDPSLFPQPVPGAINGQPGITIPLPSWGGFGQFLSLVLNAVLAFYLRKQTSMMNPPG